MEQTIIKYIIIAILIVVLCAFVGLSLFVSADSSSTSSSSSSVSSGIAASFWWPIEPGEDGKPKTTYISSGYDYRTIDGVYGFHYGIDIAGGGSPKIIATYDGVVTHAGDGSYGTSVYIKHEFEGKTIYSIYGHMVAGSIPSNITVGSQVSAGTVLGTMGQTGYATGVHLHFEIRLDTLDSGLRAKSNRNPLDYVDPNNPYPSKDGENNLNGVVYADTTQTTTMLVSGSSVIKDNNWAPTDLVNVQGQGSYQLQKEAAEQCYKMIQAAKNDGINIYISSAYRSYSNQNGKDWRNNELIAAPNATEHRTGLAVDFNGATNWGRWINNNTRTWEWLCDNAKNYGFILRFPLGCKNITGIHAESWHWRYIGVDNAKKFYEVAEQKGRATTPAKEVGQQMSKDEKTTNTKTYYKYTYEEFYNEYMINK